MEETMEIIGLLVYHYIHEAMHETLHHCVCLCLAIEAVLVLTFQIFGGN